MVRKPKGQSACDCSACELELINHESHWFSACTLGICLALGGIIFIGGCLNGMIKHPPATAISMGDSSHG